MGSGRRRAFFWANKGAPEVLRIGAAGLAREAGQVAFLDFDVSAFGFFEADSDGNGIFVDIDGALNASVVVDVLAFELFQFILFPQHTHNSKDGKGSQLSHLNKLPRA